MENTTDISLKQFAKELVDFMQPHGITFAKIHYNGTGDDGQIEGIELLGPGLKVNRKTKILLSQPLAGSLKGFFEREYDKAANLEEALIAFVYAWLDASNGGWTGNDGASGEVVIDCRTGDVRKYHTEFSVEDLYIGS